MRNHTTITIESNSEKHNYKPTLRALDLDRTIQKVTVETLDADIVVPGHGPVPADPRETRQGLRRFRQMLVDVRDAVQNEIARGATEDQALLPSDGPSTKKCRDTPRHATGNSRAAAVSATDR